MLPGTLDLAHDPDVVSALASGERYVEPEPEPTASGLKALVEMVHRARVAGALDLIIADSLTPVEDLRRVAGALDYYDALIVGRDDVKINNCTYYYDPGPTGPDDSGRPIGFEAVTDEQRKMFRRCVFFAGAYNRLDRFIEAYKDSRRQGHGINVAMWSAAYSVDIYNDVYYGGRNEA